MATEELVAADDILLEAIRGALGDYAYRIDDIEPEIRKLVMSGPGKKYWPKKEADRLRAKFATQPERDGILTWIMKKGWVTP